MDDAEVEVGSGAAVLLPAAGAPVERRDLTPAPVAVAPAPGRWARFVDGDFWHSFRTSPVAMGSAAVALVCLVCALFAPWIAPHDPFNLATLELSDSMLPPSWMAGGVEKYPLGTDEQGRDVLSALMFGARISLFVGLASVLVSLVIGVTLGLLSGYVGGRIDALIMRVCDVMLSFPSILIALLFAGVGHALYPNANDWLAFGVVILAIALPGWVQYARAGARLDHGRAAQGVRAGGARHRRAGVRASCCATCCPTSWAGARAVDDPGRDRDPRRSHALVSRRRRLADLAVARYPSSTKATSSSSAVPGGWSSFRARRWSSSRSASIFSGTGCATH